MEGVREVARVHLKEVRRNGKRPTRQIIPFAMKCRETHLFNEACLNDVIGDREGGCHVYKRCV